MTRHCTRNVDVVSQTIFQTSGSSHFEEVGGVGEYVLASFQSAWNSFVSIYNQSGVCLSCLGVHIWPLFNKSGVHIWPLPGIPFGSFSISPDDYCSVLVDLVNQSAENLCCDTERQCGRSPCVHGEETR